MRNPVRFALVCVLLLCAWLFAVSNPNDNFGEFNEARLRSLSQFQGLSSSKITALLKDKKGFVWIGTDNGLNRYDGNSILVFQHDPDNDLSIGNNYIQALLEDQEGNLWIGTKKGLYIFHHIDQTFHKQRFSSSNNFVINSICKDMEGHIWISTYKGLYKFHPENKLFEKVPFLEAEKGDTNLALEMHTDKKGELWIGSWRFGIFRMNPITGEYVAFQTASLKEHDIYKKGKITDIEEGPDGSLWMGGWGIGLLRIYPNRKTSKIYTHDYSDINTINGNKIKALKFDEIGYLWIGIEESGLDRFAPESEIFTHYLNDFQRTDIVEGPSIYSIMVDNQSLMWLGFRNDGVKIVPLMSPSFTKFSLKNKDTGVFSICETEKGIFVGSRGAIELFDPDNQLFKTYPLPNKETPIALYDFDDKTLLIGTYRGSMLKFDLQTSTFQDLTDSDITDELYGNKIECFYKLNNDEILIGSQIGMFRLNLITDEFKKVISSWTHDIIPGDEENVWAVQWENFYQYFPQTGKLLKYETDVKGDIKTCYFTPDNQRVYLGTDLGFYTQEVNSVNAQRFHDIFPFVNNQANAIVVDNQSNFWITSETSLIFYNPTENKFKTFGKEDGLPAMRFYDGVGMKLKNGEIAFGGDNGMLIFDPLKIEDTPNDANLTFTGLTILNEKIHANDRSTPFDRDISEIDELELKYRQNIITFNFALLSYINPSKHRYRYSLEGFNDNWFDLGNQNSITFTNLDPGKYTLKIQAANEENNWGPVKILKIQVSPPFTQTWYAYLLYAAILIGIFI